MKKKLSKALQAAIKRYIDNRDNQSNVPWDKPADNIKTIGFADGFVRIEQSSGAWWFTVKRGVRLWTFYAHEDNYTKAIIGERSTACSPLSTLFRAKA